MKWMNSYLVSSKIENNTVYLEEVAVSRTKQFLVRGKKRKKKQPL